MAVRLDMDHRYMQEALALARKGWGKTGINPLVGAVVVNHDRVVGRGFHRKIGEAHAEIIALLEAGSRARGGTLYVNLEPCCTCGRTPPCVEMILRAGIRRVVIGNLDPNPAVNGNGVGCLTAAGLQVERSVLEAEAWDLNRWYAKYITQKIPYVYLKIAASHNGKISEFSKRYITSEQSLRLVHALRGQVDAIMVGINTVVRDDPFLTDRLVGRGNPARLILDPRLRIPLAAHFLAPDSRRIIITSMTNDKEKVEKLVDQGVEFMLMPGEYFPLTSVLKKLGELEFGSVLVEGGGLVFSQMLDKKLFDELYVFVAPVDDGKGVDVLQEISRAIDLTRCSPTKNGKDILYHVYRDN